MPTRRQLFELFPKSELVKISKGLDYEGWSTLSKDEIVDRLFEQRAFSIDKIKISDLRFICMKLDLNPGGLQKQTLVNRILGKDAQPSEKDPRKIKKLIVQKDDNLWLGLKSPFPSRKPNLNLSTLKKAPNMFKTENPNPYRDMENR